MKKKECPSCAMEVSSKADDCPICGYEFPKHRIGFRLVALMLIVAFLLLLFYIG